MTESSDTMADSLETDFEVGAFLRQARKESAMTVGQAASSLRLPEATIRRLENESGAFAEAPVYIRGYVKNYARLLNVELPQSYLTTPTDCEVDWVQTGGQQRWKSTAEALARRSAYLVATGLVVGTLLAWLYEPMQPDYQGADLVTGTALDRDMLEDAANQLQNEEPPRRAQAASMTPLRLASDTLPDPRSTDQQPQAEPSDDQLATDISVLDTASITTSQTTPQTVERITTESGLTLLLRTTADSWVQLENNGERLVYDLVPAGSEQSWDLSPGQLNVLFGYAPGVELILNGEVVDLSTHTNGDVARFQLPVGDVARADEVAVPGP